MKITLLSARLRLRPFNHSDFENLRQLDSDSDIMKFTPAKVPQTREQSIERLERYIKMGGVWAVELKESGEFIGWFMLIETDLEFPEIGFMIVKKFWGRGLATECARTLIDYGLNILRHKGISGRVNSDNVISIQVMKKLGFQLVRNSEGLSIFKFNP